MSAITIPEGFFPPPGVPFSTDAQRDLAVAMHNAGLIKVEARWNGGEFQHCNSWSGNMTNERYRLAPTKPRTVGPFESDNAYDSPTCMSSDAYHRALKAARDSGFQRFRIKLTATAEEILP